MEKRQCAQCSKTFTIEDCDVAFYKKIDVPPPTLCPDCRQQRRLAFRNESTLYSRTCDSCAKKIISLYSADSSYTVYCSDCWWSDRWDAHTYGRDVDFSRPFFEQWQELHIQVPRIALNASHNENSDYVNQSGYNKNCYLLFAGEYNKDVLYGTQVIKSKNCVDVLNCIESEYCYEAVDVEKCYKTFFSRNCKNCTDALFLFDCRSCSDCLFCVNLRNKNYYIFNKPYSKEEYLKKKEKIIRQLRAGDVAPLHAQFQEIYAQAIHRPAEIANCESSVGDYLFNSKNCTTCFDVTKAENCAFVFSGFNITDLHDACHTTDAELAYESTSVGYGSYNTHFTINCWGTVDSYYVDVVHSSHDLFGCVGMNKAQFCILNKEYTEDEYRVLLPRVIAHMQNTGEWGEFFPMHYSQFAYNETVAHEYFPLSEQDVKACGLRWIAEPAYEQKKNESLSCSIDDAQDDICNMTLVCETTGKSYKVTKQELAFYRSMGLPIPRRCPRARHAERFHARNPRQLWHRQCMCTQPSHDHHGRCAQEFETCYSPDRKELIYCETCYQKEIS